jgi:type IV secretion system protein TrbB
VSTVNIREQRQLDFFYDSLGVIKKYLDDDSVTDIMLNPDGRLWLDTFNRGQVLTDEVISFSDAECIIRAAANMAGDFFDQDKPSVSIEFPVTGERFQGIMPPQTKKPVFSIRKKPSRVMPLDEYLSSKIITNEQYDFLVSSVRARKNIVVAGPTGSGKTTFANAILNEVAKLNTRVAILEDTAELQCNAKNSYSFKTTSQVGMGQLLKDTLRMNIDSIVVGEVRGGEALDLLKAWNTGHPGGVATIHSDSAIDALYRLEQLILEASPSSQRNLISRAVNIVIFLEKNSARQRKVKEILKVRGLTERVSPYLVEPLKKDVVKSIVPVNSFCN